MRKFKEIFLCGSLRKRLMFAFVITAIIPICIVVLFSYVNTFHIVRDNVDELLQVNLLQTNSSLDVWMESYKDILFQVYMDDNIVDMVEDINVGKDMTMRVGQLRRTLRGMFYTKEYIKCITVITENGNVISYDLLTGSATQTLWMESMSKSQKEIYDYFGRDNNMHMLPTECVGTFGADKYYLFHMGHRIIDYRNIDKELGVVIISMDETMLQEIGGNQNREIDFTFMVDKNGVMMSCPNKEFLGKKIIDWSENAEERKEKYKEFWEENMHEDAQTYIMQVVHNEAFGVDIIRLSSQLELIERLDIQRNINLLVWGITLALVFGLICIWIKNLMKSINRLVEIMRIAQEGELSVRAVEDQRTPTEIQMIERQFNHMMEELEISIKKEKEANEKQKNAEIAALEAQINPHFLYNTLDTINWMAINKDDYEISNSITSLAKILRYGIDNSNAEVNVQMEVEWLKQYLFLQQIRLKNMFECEINVSSEVMGWKIHKLLFQPFVENAILHGFQTEKMLHILRISIEAQADQMLIEIWDNGKGMSDDFVAMINRGEYPKGREKNSIGMNNAINRIQMYYGEKASVYVESCLGEYTSVHILIPKVLAE